MDAPLRQQAGDELLRDLAHRFPAPLVDAQLSDLARVSFQIRPSLCSDLYLIGRKPRGPVESSV